MSRPTGNPLSYLRDFLTEFFIDYRKPEVVPNFLLIKLRRYSESLASNPRS